MVQHLSLILQLAMLKRSPRAVLHHSMTRFRVLGILHSYLCCQRTILFILRRASLQPHFYIVALVRRLKQGEVGADLCVLCTNSKVAVSSKQTDTV